MSELAEAIWEQVPLGAVPEHFAPRRDWLLGHVERGARVLDLGCGAGEFASALRAAGAAPVGVDVAREPLRRAAERDPSLDLRLWGAGEPLPASPTPRVFVLAPSIVWHAQQPLRVTEITEAAASGCPALLLPAAAMCRGDS